MFESAIELLASLGRLAQTSEGQGAIILFTSLGGVLAWVGKKWIFGTPAHRQEICYSFISKDLVSPGFLEIPGLEIVVNGVKQPMVSVTNLCVWNQGSKVVLNSDWAPTAPLTVAVPKDCKVLSFQLTSVTRKACNVQVFNSGAEGGATVGFDFLGNGDGAVMQLVHTGMPIGGKVMVSGALIDGPDISYLHPDPLIDASRKAVWGMGKFLSSALANFGIAVVVFFVFFLLLKLTAVGDSEQGAFFVAAFIAIGVAAIRMFNAMLEAWWYRNKPRLPPLLRDALLGIKKEDDSKKHGKFDPFYDSTWSL